jgi:hypothetical protein
MGLGEGRLPVHHGIRKIFGSRVRPVQTIPGSHVTVYARLGVPLLHLPALAGEGVVMPRVGLFPAS